MAKEDFTINIISKQDAATILSKYHYLSNISKGFKSGYNFGCFHNNLLVGVIIYTGLPVPELAKGMFGLARNEQNGLFELSRLCLEPTIQAKEHNLASWFVAKSIKILKTLTEVKAILSYADSDYHSGIIYAACNFNYYGLTSPKKDFYIRKDDGTFIKHSRGSVKNIAGEWRERSRKHRFVLLYDKNLSIQWEKTRWVNPSNQSIGD